MSLLDARFTRWDDRQSQSKEEPMQQWFMPKFKADRCIFVGLSGPAQLHDLSYRLVEKWTSTKVETKQGAKADNTIAVYSRYNAAMDMKRRLFLYAMMEKK